MSRTMVLGVAAAAAALLGSAYALTRGGGGTPVGASRADAPATGPLRVMVGQSPSARHDAGTVAPAGRLEVPFVVSNPGPVAVMIGPVRTSCDCLRVELDATRVEAGTEVGGRAVVDLAREPGFAGGLMLDAEASAAEGGRVVFALKLSVEVR